MSISTTTCSIAPYPPTEAVIRQQAIGIPTTPPVRVRLNVSPAPTNEYLLQALQIQATQEQSAARSVAQ